MRFEYADESDRGPYPIPRNVKIEGGRQSDGDRHALILDRDNCRLYELFALYPEGNGWRAGSGAIWNLRTNRLRPAGWTSADAAGLPILPASPVLTRLRADGSTTRCASRSAGHGARTSTPPATTRAAQPTRTCPMGLRLRLKASFRTAGYPRQARIVLEALKRYGMMVSDNGSDWYITGAPDPRWSNEQLRAEARARLGVRGRGHEPAPPALTP